MEVKVHYQGLESTPWLEEFIVSRVQRLDRFLGPAAWVHVNLKHEKLDYVTSLSIHNLNNDFAFTSMGPNLFESFSIAIDMAIRTLVEQKRKIKDKIHRRPFPLETESFDQ